jgi:radical SAM-linked protein
MRLLVKYAKEGQARLLSHRETMRSLERAIRRSGLPAGFTSGYSPRLRMSFAPALPLGIAAEGEYMELAVEGSADLEAAMETMNRALPEGIRIADIQELPATMPKLSKWARYGLYRVSEDGRDTYLLLSLAGPKQGRLREALASLAASCGWEERVHRSVCRIGLYAGEQEVFEDIDEVIHYFDGELQALVTIDKER